VDPVRNAGWNAMGIDHRLHPRYCFERPVVLSHVGKVLGDGHVIEISLGGMKIKHLDFPIEEGKVVCVDFIKSPFQKTVISSLRAMVIHSGAGVSGLMLSDELFADDIIQMTR